MLGSCAHHHRRDILAKPWMGQGDHRRLEHAGDAVQHVFHPPGGDLQLVHLGENVGGKAGDALKLMHGLRPAGEPGGG